MESTPKHFHLSEEKSFTCLPAFVVRKASIYLLLEGVSFELMHDYDERIPDDVPRGYTFFGVTDMVNSVYLYSNVSSGELIPFLESMEYISLPEKDLREECKRRGIDVAWVDTWMDT